MSGVIAMLAAVVLLMSSAVAARAAEPTPDDVARVLAGIAPSPTSPLEPWTRDAAWQRHKAAFDKAWADLDARRLSKIRAWSAANLTAPQPTLLYMFSGPDFLYANDFFPSATTYVLAGLEPPGSLPRLDAGTRPQLPAMLGGLRASLDTVFSYSFFRTKDMQTSLQAGALNGTIPLLYVFLARAGKTILDADLVELGADGVPTRRGRTLSRGAAPGVAITFQSPVGQSQVGPKQTLYYFGYDLSDASFRSGGLATLMQKLGPADVFLKGASYLMHTAGFARVRQHLLDHGATIVQEDSGIPIHAFKPDAWDLRPFGRYAGPDPEFPNKHQPRLVDLHRRASPLDFGVGYRWRPGEANLLLAVKRLPPREEAEPAKVAIADPPSGAVAVARAEPAPRRPRPKQVVRQRPGEGGFAARTFFENQ